MKPRIIIMLCFMACLQGAMAQNTVESIRQRYQSMKEYISTHTDQNLNDGAEFGEFYHLNVRQWLPATGGHLEDTYFYWGEVEDNEDLVYPDHYLEFVTTRYNFAARNYYEEYLYDADGNVAFIYAYDPMKAMEDGADDKEYEFRFYMNKGRLIKGIIMQKGYEQQAFKEEWQGTKLPAKYADVYSGYMASANQLKELFVNIEKRSYSY